MSSCWSCAETSFVFFGRSGVPTTLEMLFFPLLKRSLVNPSIGAAFLVGSVSLRIEFA